MSVYLCPAFFVDPFYRTFLFSLFVCRFMMIRFLQQKNELINGKQLDRRDLLTQIVIEREKAVHNHGGGATAATKS